MPVPPPTIAIGVWPNRCSRASAITGQQRSDVQARRGRIEADVRGHAFLVANSVRQPFRGVVHHAAPFQLVEEIHRGFVLL